jgi:hypothetical protein
MENDKINPILFLPYNEWKLKMLQLTDEISSVEKKQEEEQSFDEMMKEIIKKQNEPYVFLRD